MLFSQSMRWRCLWGIDTPRKWERRDSSTIIIFQHQLIQCTQFLISARSRKFRQGHFNSWHGCFSCSNSKPLLPLVNNTPIVNKSSMAELIYWSHPPKALQAFGRYCLCLLHRWWCKFCLLSSITFAVNVRLSMRYWIWKLMYRKSDTSGHNKRLILLRSGTFEVSASGLRAQVTYPATAFNFVSNSEYILMKELCRALYTCRQTVAQVIHA